MKTFQMFKSEFGEFFFAFTKIHGCPSFIFSFDFTIESLIVWRLCHDHILVSLYIEHII